METFKFVPNYGSSEAINAKEKSAGNFYMAKEGAIYFDVSSEERVKIASLDANYVHEQRVSSNEWIINHNLNKLPNITVIDSAGTEVKGEVVYIDPNTIKLVFSVPFSGKAVCN